jgi:hypothetical protein
MDRAGIKSLWREVFGPNVVMVDQDAWVSVHCPFALNP